MSKLNLEQLKKQAKDLVRDRAARTPEAFAFIRANHPAWAGASDERIASGAFQLSDAQWAIARSLGEASWPALIHRLAEVPLVPVRGLVVFPGQHVTLQIGRARSKVAVEAAQRDDGVIALVAQRAAQTDEPALGDLHAIGTLGCIVATQPADADRQATIRVEGLRRVRVVRLDERDGMLVAETTPIDADDISIDPEAAKQAAMVTLDAIARQLPRPPEASVARALILPHLNSLPTDVQQRVLETDDPAQWVHALGR